MEKFISEIITHSAQACKNINSFSSSTLKTRGGRVGSGMGLLIEALWGYQMNIELADHPVEIGWFPDHQYNDFVCLKKDEEWNTEDKSGEVCRIEVKSMNIGADESKAHFDVLKSDIDPNDLLLIITWEWKSIDEYHSIPFISDYFIGIAHDIIDLRDCLHVTRGGIFTNHTNCPESCDCEEGSCSYYGEPLNSASKRERLSGPPITRPSQRVAYAANFGGLLRMIKTSGEESRTAFRKFRRRNITADNYISFIHKNYPNEELNQFTKAEWLTVAKSYDSEIKNNLSKSDLFSFVTQYEDYQKRLRDFL